jgi:rhodanese-related sulfurtransferase
LLSNANGRADAIARPAVPSTHRRIRSMPHRVLTIREAQALLRERGNTVLDMRDAANSGRGHIPGAQHLTDALLAEPMRDGARRKPTLLCWASVGKSGLVALLSGAGADPAPVSQCGVSAPDLAAERRPLGLLRATRAAWERSRDKLQGAAEVDALR